MTQAIITKYLGATNNRGARIKATCLSGSVTVSWDYSLGCDANHEAAALALGTKLGWTEFYTMESGQLPDAKGMAFILKWN